MTTTTPRIESATARQASTDPFAAFRGQNFMRLTTFRRSGVPVATNVWFAHDGDRLVVTTAANAGKVKRLRHTSSVRAVPVAPWGAVRGIELEAVAHVLPPAEHARAEALLRRKYGWQWRLFQWLSRKNPHTYIAVTPAG